MESARPCTQFCFFGAAHPCPGTEHISPATTFFFLEWLDHQSSVRLCGIRLALRAQPPEASQRHPWYSCLAPARAQASAFGKAISWLGRFVSTRAHNPSVSWFVRRDSGEHLVRAQAPDMGSSASSSEHRPKRAPSGMAVACALHNVARAIGPCPWLEVDGLARMGWGWVGGLFQRHRATPPKPRRRRCCSGGRR